MNVSGQQNLSFLTRSWQQPQFTYPDTPSFPGYFAPGVYCQAWAAVAADGTVIPQQTVNMNPQHLSLSTPGQVGSPQYPSNHAIALPQNTSNFHEPQLPPYDLALPDDEWIRQRWNVPY
jgi:hypothetical protein